MASEAMTEGISDDGRVKVEWVDLGEGFSGDYNPDDPTDKPLLRYDAYTLEEGQWVEMDDGSYCTLVEATTPETTLATYAKYMANQLASALPSPKKMAERLSWMPQEPPFPHPVRW